jgi:hypothetical protein
LFILQSVLVKVQNPLIFPWPYNGPGTTSPTVYSQNSRTPELQNSTLEGQISNEVWQTHAGDYAKRNVKGFNQTKKRNWLTNLSGKTQKGGKEEFVTEGRGMF